MDDNQKLINRVQLVLDVCVITLSYFLAWLIQFELIVDETTGKLPFSTYMSALIFLIPGILLLYYAFNLYTSKRIQGRRLELGNIIKANGIAVLVFFATIYLMRETDFSRNMIFIFFGLDVCLETLVRNLFRMALMNNWRRGINVRQMVLVGYSRAAEEYIDRINQNPQWGLKVRGILDDNVERGTMYKGVKVIGRIENLNVILPFGSVDEIAITLGLSEYYKLEHIVALCEKSGVHTKFIPDYNNIIPTKPYTEDLLGLPVINIRHVPLSNPFNKMVKRAMDLVGGTMALIVFSPIMLVAAILIKLTSPGPLIFKQERVGLHNKPFCMYKFRSMEVQKECDEKACWTVRNDPRVTGIGKFMRRTSIDELPQIFNVLKGDMSLVGPRPERPQFVEKFREEIPRYMVKHQVRPGMTGWAQVNGYRGDTSIRKRIDCDLYYIENWTVGMDIKIILLTFFKGFVNKNAY
ncbi:MAG TPA: undecaprenyl-phosphate glucose phosphotransferase [Candidatus Limivivens intestinipullorum]|uniref:Undecaprenyl-phosphate glucose phosphotransferase n=1 Tax=Candidatus Limivivens intestinipullorum TaxID=2840858 RepID=A0A9D1JK20_9FIRM|nr:undecaprenyl-phosphate glucose phosphotransferase [Candidatus Limivivens intestinipullorum]